MSLPILHEFGCPGLLISLGFKPLAPLFARFSVFPEPKPRTPEWFYKIAKMCSFPKDLPEDVVRTLAQIESFTTPEKRAALSLPADVSRETALYDAIRLWTTAQTSGDASAPVSTPPAAQPAPSTPPTSAPEAAAAPPLSLGPETTSAPEPSFAPAPEPEPPRPPRLYLRPAVLLYEAEPRLQHAFFNRFQKELCQAFPDIPQPAPATFNYKFYEAAYLHVKTPALLPDPILDALRAIQELAATQNRPLLRHLIAKHCGHTRETLPDQLALEVWLAHPVAWQDIPRLLAELPPPPPPTPGHDALPLPDPDEVLLPVPPPPPPPEKPAPGDFAALARFPRNKISKLPPALREELNSLLRKRVPYRHILAQLGSRAPDLNPTNLSRWRKTGFLLWLAEQERREDARAQVQLLFDLLQDNDAEKIHDATQQIAELRISQMLASCDPAALVLALQSQPQTFVRLLQTLPSLSHGANERQRLLLELAERSHPAKTEDQPRGMSKETLQYITQKLNLF